jgi:hypothetical protein
MFMKKMKCILLAAVLILLSPSLSGAAGPGQYTVRGIRDQAASGWHKTYQSYGRAIEVDIPVQVPDADTFPALIAVPMPALNNIPITGEQGYDQGNDRLFNEAGFFRMDSPSGKVKSEAAKNNQKNPPKVTDVKPIVRFFNNLEWDTAYAYNNTSTVRDADTLLKTTWETYFPNEKIGLMPHWVYAYGEMRYYDSKTDTFSGSPWLYFQGPMMVYFDQVIRGIPVLCYSMNSFGHYTGPVKNEKRGYVGATAILQEMKDIGLEGMSQSLQYALLMEQQVLEADVPLCSLDKAIGAYEQLIMEGKLRTALSLRLGYVVWYNKGEPESYSLLPAWVLEGELFKSAKDERKSNAAQSASIPGEYGPILVNAQSGELIDPWNDSPDRSFDQPDILLWK